MSAVRTPVETGDDRTLDPQRIQKRERVDGHHGLLSVPCRVVGQETCRAEPAQVRNDHPAVLRCEKRCDLGETVDVVRPAVQEQHRLPIRWTCLRVADVQHTGVDLFQGPEVHDDQVSYSSESISRYE